MNEASAVKIARGARAAEAWLLAELGELCEKAREDPRRLADRRAACVSTSPRRSCATSGDPSRA
jgi:hypothetical protein